VGASGVNRPNRALPRERFRELGFHIHEVLVLMRRADTRFSLLFRLPSWHRVFRSLLSRFFGACARRAGAPERSLRGISLLRHARHVNAR